MTGDPPEAAHGPVCLLPVHGIGEVTPGTDLAAALCAAADLQDGDVLVVTSKVVSKADGLVRRTAKEKAVAAETDRLVAARRGTVIVRNHQGLVMAGAGVDASNTEPGTVVLLPADPDRSAVTLREAIAARTNRNVAVVVSDTSGRTWRTGQTDIAIGAAGLQVMRDYVGLVDGHGNRMLVSVSAVADELAAAADLVKGKLTGCPAAVLRGLGLLVLPSGQHGAGAASLVRSEAEDLFGYGARDAVAQALAGDPAGLRGFGRPCEAEELVASLRALGLTGRVSAHGPGRVDVMLPVPCDLQEAREAGRSEARATALAFACGWTRVPAAPDDDGLGFAPAVSVH